MTKRDIRADKVRKNFYITLVVLLTVLVITYVYTRPLKVEAVIEGNTLILSNGREVRLIGVDKNGRAHTFLSTLVQGKSVRLEYDKQKTDEKGRLLVYVYLSDGRFLNAEMIMKGFASVDREIPFKHRELFERYQQEAKESKQGMWAE
jgi:micrococcal nuclease